MPDSVTRRAATPDGSAFPAPTAGEPVDSPSADRYWRAEVDREVLFNLRSTLAD